MALDLIIVEDDFKFRRHLTLVAEEDGLNVNYFALGRELLNYFSRGGEPANHYLVGFVGPTIGEEEGLRIPEGQRIYRLLHERAISFQSYSIMSNSESLGEASRVFPQQDFSDITNLPWLDKSTTDFIEYVEKIAAAKQQ